ncbi:hypothetical protein CEE75_12085 [Lactobacillus crispatus]|uniref:Uncharacterized protein n=1 Tax=Lactobacillus crispatus TaxID=47770 RepID=A0A135Z8H8_9LACO|nr:hypothetical protein AEL98_08875 [Lactobacillus crispatus]KWU14553.1 hypothetical protein AEM00_06980 [Lactobacillus crispatus]KXI17938.1 hypothetical protein HMPREF3209_01255 [Lactobacillus crispatus]TDN28926.1 hypothetical protein CEE75_12085 [Lactobacillus crispatus]
MDQTVTIKTKLLNIDEETAQTFHDLSWLWYPIKFKRPQLDLERNRDWSYLSSTKQISLNTLQGRKKVDFVCKGFNQYLDIKEN